jgi:choline dehydrogenase
MDTRINLDYNDPENALGVGAAQWNVKDGIRQSTGMAYLTHEVRKRRNLTIAGLSYVTRIVIEHGRVHGVEFKRGLANLNEGTSVEHTMTALESDPKQFVKANSEVVLCGGAIQSPQMLMLSGIGPRSELEHQRIKVHKDLPEVGRNLQDHLFLPMFFEIEDESAFSTQVQKGCRSCSIGDRFSGPPIKTLLFTSSNGSSIPDIEFHLSWTPLKGKQVFELLLALGMNLTDPFWTTYLSNAAAEKPLCLCLPSLILPKSRGEVILNSRDPLAYPRCNFNYLSKQDDMDIFSTSINLLRDILKTEPMSKVIGREIINPELPGSCDPSSKEYMEAYIRSGATTIYHASGTCALHSVVDKNLCVKGVKGLLVADASIMPRITPGNTNWPSIMIGERAADLIRKSKVNS